MKYKKLAIACQGGGSLTAYQAGMLGALLSHAKATKENGAIKIIIEIKNSSFENSDNSRSDSSTAYELVGFSGASGGAQNAAIAWNACVDGAPSRAAQELSAWWDSIKAHPTDLSLFGGWLHSIVRICNSLFGVFDIDIHPQKNLIDTSLRDDFLARIRNDLPPTLFRSTRTNDKIQDIPLFISAIEVISGSFACFLLGDELERGRRTDKLDEINIEHLTALTPEHLLASASIPQLFTGQNLKMTAHATADHQTSREYRLNEPLLNDGLISQNQARAAWATPPREGQYWDGLYSENPPISPFMRYRDELIPDEILILRINPRSIPAAATDPARLTDRDNELICNLSLAQEIYSIRKANQRSHQGKKVTAVRELDLPWQEHQNLYYNSKYARYPDEIDHRLRIGKDWANKFVAGQLPPLKNWAA